MSFAYLLFRGHGIRKVISTALVEAPSLYSPSDTEENPQLYYSQCPEEEFLSAYLSIPDSNLLKN